MAASGGQGKAELVAVIADLLDYLGAAAMTYS